MRSRRWLAPLLLALGAALLLSAAAANGYLLTVAINIGLWYLVVAGLNLLMGHAGQFSLGQAALYGTGAYATAIAETRLGVHPLLALPIAIGAGAVLAFAVGVPLTRLRGHFLAMATLAFQVVFSEVVTQWDDVTGGGNGIIGREPLSIGGVQFLGLPLLILIGVVDLAVFLALRNLVAYRTGRALAAVKSDEVMSESFGIDAGRYRVVAFVIAGGLAGLGGYFFFQHLLFIDPSPFDLGASVLLVATLVIGGQGAAAGPFLGVAVFFALHSVLAEAPSLEALLFGAALVVVVILAPFGVSGVLGRAVARIRGERGTLSLELGVPERQVLPAGLFEARAAGETAPLVVTGVSKSFGGLEVLKSVSLSIREPGKVLSLIGPNGAGKSTLVNLITGNEPIDAGTVEIFGRRTHGLRSREIAALGVARTFQVPRLASGQTVLENVLIGMHQHLRESLIAEALATPGVRSTERRAREEARDILSFVGLARAADQPVRTLPHGPRRIVEVARALAARPMLLLLDEPAAGLNEVEIEWLANILRACAADRGLSILLIDHRMDLVMTLSDEVVVLDAGSVIATDTPERVQKDDAVADAYLGRLVNA